MTTPTPDDLPAALVVPVARFAGIHAELTDLGIGSIASAVLTTARYDELATAIARLVHPGDLPVAVELREAYRVRLEERALAVACAQLEEILENTPPPDAHDEDDVVEAVIICHCPITADTGSDSHPFDPETCVLLDGRAPFLDANPTVETRKD